MSKICENCGNMIPDGADICPGCGRQQYDDALESILSELSFALDEIQSDDSENTSAEAPKSDAIPDLNLDDDLDLDLNLGDDLDLNLNLDTVSKASAQETKAPVSQKPVDPAIAAIGAKTQENMGGKPAAIKTSVSSVGAKKSSGKKKGKSSNSGSSAIAIIVGILIALLLVAGAAFFMLYRMGFFDLMNGEQLLASSSGQSQSVSTVESIQEPVETEPAVVEEASAEEEKEPVEEEPQIMVPELSMEETDEPEIQVDKFNLTGADDMTFTARGETAQIVYVIAPEDAEPDIEWVSSDDTIATVSASGVITARRGGNCTITGTCGDKEVSVEVRCTFTVPTTVLDMNYSDITMDHEGQEVQLKIDYELTAAQTKATVWESSDPQVASVNDEGLVTAVGNGTVVVTASIGDYTASCIVRCVGVAGNEGVNPENSEYVINYEDVTLSRKGEYFQLSMKSILGNELPEYTWKSTDTSVATVDSKGVVTAVANGTCKITTTVGKDNFECIVRVHISG